MINSKDLISKFQKVSHLWDAKTKKVFRYFIFGFIFVLFAWFALQLSLTILIFVEQDVLFQQLKTSNTNFSDSDIRTIVNSQKAHTLIKAILNLALCSYFVFRTITCYKEKSFANLSTFVVLFVFISSIYSISTFFYTLLKGGYDGVGASGVNRAILAIYILELILSIGSVYLALNIMRIINVFRYVRFQEAAQELTKIFNASAGNTIFDNSHATTNPFTGFNNENTATNNFSAEKTNEEQTKKDEIIKKLFDLPNDKLYEIAEKMHIFGYKDMDKETLVNTIYNYSKQSQKEEK
ncbi:hypothetical protein [Mycoplasmopsis gallinacea]|uniref:Rho termination factor N-terminal domain-containing protein n=1 Tax=Mycoplasmopsis gallinacea TaxID=29556 RepID=A0A449A3C0_9BACT|nr:hypothetical protein [Mycoplasmopsis gallinacea]VEU58712.1 Uncharacterised protein [Mycoplasmopsis gallinacea]